MDQNYKTLIYNVFDNIFIVECYLPDVQMSHVIGGCKMF